MSARTIPSPIIGEYLHDLTEDYWDVLRIFTGDGGLESQYMLGVCLRRQHPPNTDASASLYRLPVEVLQSILLSMDIKSLVALRKVSLFARFLVETMPQYSRIANNMPDVLRALAGTGLAPFMSLGTLHQNLRQPSCISCGDFAPFLYLLTCERVCVVCLDSRFKFRPVTRSEAKATYKLDARALRKLPALLSLPGRYSHSGKEPRRRIVLYDRGAVATAARARAGPSFEEMAIPSTDMKTDVHRYMSVMRLPWLNTEEHRLEWGLTCRACLEQEKRRDHSEQPYSDLQYDGYPIDEEELEDEEQDTFEQFVSASERSRAMRLDWRTMYTKHGFTEHVKDCKGSRQLLNELLRKSRKLY